MPTYMNDMGEFVDRFDPKPRLKLKHDPNFSWESDFDGDDEPVEPQGKFVKICDVCGREFRTSIANMLRCSADCRKKAEAKRKRKSNVDKKAYEDAKRSRTNPDKQ